MVLTIDQMGSRWQNGNWMRSELDAERIQRRYVRGRGGLGGVVSTELGTKKLYKTLWFVQWSCLSLDLGEAMTKGLCL